MFKSSKWPTGWNTHLRTYLLTYLITYSLTYSMQQSPSWETNRISASQKIPRISRNQNFHYRIHKRPPPVPNLSQLDPVHNPSSNVLNIHLNIILPSLPGSPKWFISFRLSYQNHIYASPPPYALHVPPISFFSISSPEQYWVRSTDH